MGGILLVPVTFAAIHFFRRDGAEVREAFDDLRVLAFLIGVPSVMAGAWLWFRYGRQPRR